MGRDIFRYTRLLRAPSNLALNTSGEGAATASPGNLFQCLTTLMVKNFFLISNLNLPSFSLEPLSLVLTLHTLVKGCRGVGAAGPALINRLRPHLCPRGTSASGPHTRSPAHLPLSSSEAARKTSGTPCSTRLSLEKQASQAFRSVRAFSFLYL